VASRAGRAEWRVGAGPAAHVQDGEVRAVVVRDAGLTELPDSLRALTGLRELDLGGNRLSELPQWIGELSELRLLLVHENPLRGLPDSLAALRELRLLDLGHNPGLRTLPGVVGELPALEVLYASHLGLTELAALPPLRYLGIGHNELTELGELPPSLQTLNLRGNRLERLPDSIGALRALVHLDLRANRLTAVPAALAELPELRILDLRWNGFAEIPPALRPLAQRGCLIHF
jgi:Leucine-rich repeat (LRR) protein